jgi:hypothetical protein
MIQINALSPNTVHVYPCLLANTYAVRRWFNTVSSDLLPSMHRALDIWNNVRVLLIILCTATTDDADAAVKNQ